jgi:uncharacterized membrane protein YfcA
LEFILLFLVGICATFIGTLAGSGGLINFPTMLLLGIPVHSAIGANKFSNMFSSFSSFITLLLKKEVSFRSVVKIGPFSLLGGLTGGYVATLFSQEIMTIIATGLLIFAFGISFISKPKTHTEQQNTVPILVFPAILGIGIYDGVFGPGQGTLQMHLFTHQNISYLKAIAFTRFNTFLSCVGAFISYFLSGHMIWPVAFALMSGSVIGAQIAVRVAGKVSKKMVTYLLRVITLLLIIQLLSQLIKPYFL